MPPLLTAVASSERKVDPARTVTMHVGTLVRVPGTLTVTMVPVERDPVPVVKPKVPENESQTTLLEQVGEVALVPT